MKNTTKTSKTDTPLTMEQLLASHESKLSSLKRGESVSAKLINLGKKTASFDIGGKSEGIVSDLYFQEAKDYLKVLKVGDEVKAIVVEPETREGLVLLSLRDVTNDSAWDELNQALAKDEDISVVVKNVSAAGLIVEHGLIQGFIPMSQVGKKVATSADDALNKSLKVKVLNIDKEKKRVVFSEKLVSEAEGIKLLKKAIDKVKEGEMYEGVVKHVTDFGAFVGIKINKVEVEGLVYISELSWEKVNKVSDMFSDGDKVKVKVIGTKGGKLSLSIRQASSDPWEKAAEKYHVDDKINGEVVRISDFGAFVALESGVEGLIHITKIPPSQKLKVGGSVNCYIEEIDIANKKISLGLILTSKPVGYK